MENVINSKRIYYLDLVRGLAVFFMVMQHTMIVHEYTGGEGHGFIGNLFVILGTAPAAPVFMFIMGLFIMKSRLDSKGLIKRGVKLLICGYVLNLLRFTIPILIAKEANALEMFWGVDILQLAGLSFILAVWIRKIATNKFIIPILSVIILIISPYLWGITSNPFSNLFWGTSSEVAFPFFPWCIYPMLGMYLSPYLVKEKIDKKVKKRMLVSASIIGAIGLSTVFLFPHLDYSRYGLGASLIIVAFVFFYLLFSDFLISKFANIRESKLAKVLYYWSEEVTEIYIIQWIIFGWSMLVLGANEFNDIVAMFIGFTVMLITHLLIRYTKIKKLIPQI